jgi:H+/Cl- antiporter ClcA
MRAQQEPTGIAKLIPLLLWAGVIGLVAAAGAVAFTTVEHWLQHWLWQSLPDRFGWDEPAWWWVIAILMLGAVLTFAASQLPGHGGHRPLQGLSMDIDMSSIVSVVLAALASLSFGAVLGPEAPLLAIGTAIGYAAVRKQHPERREVLMLAGGMAAVSVVFGNPLVVAILLLEASVLTAAKGPAIQRLLPALVALGSGYILQVGVGSWTGFGEAELSVPGLPEYLSLEVIDLLVSVPLALLVGLLIVIAIRLGEWIEPRAETWPLAGIMTGALAIAVAAIGTRAITGSGVELVLFSGQAAIPDLLTLTSIGTIVVVVVAKTIAYSVSLGSGFKGGLVFPAVFLGIGVATAAAQLIPDTSLSALTAAGIAAGTAAAIRLPFTAVLLAVLLGAGAGLAITSLAIIGSVVGLLIRLDLDARTGILGPGVTKKPASAPSESRP